MLLAQYFWIGFAGGSGVCLSLIALLEAGLYVSDRRRRVERARANARRREQEKFFTQWHEGAL